MDDQSKRKRVMCPVQGKDNKTYWLRMGTAFVNRDNSINIYLDAVPANFKLQVRDWDDPPRKGQAQFGLAAVPSAPATQGGDDLPF